MTGCRKCGSRIGTFDQQLADMKGYLVELANEDYAVERVRAHLKRLAFQCDGLCFQCASDEANPKWVRCSCGRKVYAPVANCPRCHRSLATQRSAA